MVTIVLGGIALALILLVRLHSNHSVKYDLDRSLIHVPPSAYLELSSNQVRGLWWQQIVNGRRHKLLHGTRFLSHAAQLINNTALLDDMLEKMLSELVEYLAMDMGQVFLLSEEGMLQLAVSIGLSVQQDPLPKWAFTMPQIVLDTEQPIITPDLRRWPQLKSFISATELTSTLWLPLKTGGHVLGTLGLGSCQPKAFHKEIIVMVTTVASYLATAVENFNLRQQITQEKELRQALQRYVSPRLMTTFRHGSSPQFQESIDASSRMTVLFADVRNFTPLMEQTEPDTVMQVLNEYFLRMNQIIKANGGVVDEFAGDEIVASFDHASPRVNDAYRAVRAGIEMLAGLKTLQRRWQKRELPTFDIGIGISTGGVIRGSIGSTERKALIALGSILNIASRAEGMNKKLGTQLILTQSTFEHVSHLIEYDALGEHKLQGISQPVPLYSVRGLKNHHSSEKVSYDIQRISQITQRRQSLADAGGSGLRTGLLS